MRVIETVKTSQCQVCGRPPLRCRCNLLSFICQKNKCVLNQVKRFVAETEILTGEDKRDALSPQIIIKDILQETSTHDTLPAQNDITCPRCLWKLKQTQESEERESITNNLCEHCQLKSLIRRLKKENLETAQDEQAHKKLEFGNTQVHLKRSTPSDEQKVNILNQIEIGFSAKQHELRHPSSEINIIRTESAFSFRNTTKNRSHSETNLLVLNNEAHLLGKTPVQKEIVWDTALDIEGFKKVPASTSTISYLSLDYPKVGPNEVIKKEVYVEKLKENVFSKPEKNTDHKQMYYYFPTSSKPASMVKHISSSELIKKTQEKLKKNKENKHNVEELLHIQRLESIKKRQERKLRQIAEETERQKRENKILIEEEIGKLVVKYSDETEQKQAEEADASSVILQKKIKQNLYEAITKQKKDTDLKQKEHVYDKDIMDTTPKDSKQKYHTYGRKDVDKNEKREYEAAKRLEAPHEVKQKVREKISDTNIIAKKKQESKKKIVIEMKAKNDPQSIHITKQTEEKRNIKGRLEKYEEHRTIKQEEAKKEIIKFEQQAQTVVFKLKNKTNKQIEDGRQNDVAMKIPQSEEHKKKEIVHIRDQERKAMPETQTSTDDAAKENRGVEAVEKKREEQIVDEKKKKEDDTKRKLEDKWIADDKLKADKEMQTMISSLKDGTKKPLEKRTIKAIEQQSQDQKSMEVKKAVEETAKIKKEVSIKLQEEQKRVEKEKMKYEMEMQEEDEKKIKDEIIAKQKEEEKRQHEKELKNMMTKLKEDTKKLNEEERIKDKERKVVPVKMPADNKAKQKSEAHEAIKKREEDIVDKKKKKEDDEKKELDMELKKKEEEEKKVREEQRQNEQKLLKFIQKSKEDSVKQKEEELKKDFELKALFEKQAAENMVKSKRAADEAAKKKRSEDEEEKKYQEKITADENRRKEEDKIKKEQERDDLLKKKQEQENKIKADKIKYEEELKKMMLKSKEETNKKKELELIQAQEQKALQEKQTAEELARNKKEKEEVAKRNREKEAANKMKQDEDKLSERKRKELEEAKKKQEDAVLNEEKLQADRKIKEEKLKYEEFMKKMILQYKVEQQKLKEQERIKSEEQKAFLEKQVALEEARQKRSADEAAKMKRDIETAIQKKRNEEIALEYKRKEQEELKKKQDEANLLKQKQEEEKKMKEEEKQLEKKILIMAAQLKEETKKKDAEELKRAQELALLLKRQAEVEEKKRQEAEVGAKKKKQEEAADEKKQIKNLEREREIKEKQKLAMEEETRVQREIIEKEKENRAKEEAEKQNQRALDQDIRDIIAKEKKVKEEQQKREPELDNNAKNMTLKLQVAMEVAKKKLENQNAAAEKVMEHIHVEDIHKYTYDAIPPTVLKPVTQNIVIGENISQFKPPLPPDPLLHEPPGAIIPMMFKKTAYLLDGGPIEHNLKQMEKVDKKDIRSTKRSTVPEPIADEGGVVRYALSDRSFIDKGWTVLPIEKVVRKMNVYRMRPAQPEFNWFEHNKQKRLLFYDSGEKLAEFDSRGQCHWYYRNGRLALDYYEAEELNAQQRFVVYSNGEPDERGRARPFTVLATFDFLGSGVVFDHGGKIRLTYNQTEGIVLDRQIGPAATWKWHSLNDPPVLQQVMIDTKLAHKDPTILSLGDKKLAKSQERNDAQMVAIEFDNFIKDKKKKLTQKFKPFQIKMKALKINENFSLKILDQATVYLIFREGSANIKLNIGMILDHKEIIDTDTADLGVVANTVSKFPAATDSVAAMQRSVEYAQRFERSRTERDRILHPLPPGDSAERLVAGLSKPLKAVPKTIPFVGSKSYIEECKCNRKPSSNLYYNSRLS